VEESIAICLFFGTIQLRAEAAVWRAQGESGNRSDRAKKMRMFIASPVALSGGGRSLGVVVENGRVPDLAVCENSAEVGPDPWVAVSRPSVASRAPDGTAANRHGSGEYSRQPIEGPADVGKSHLARALGHEACRRGFDVGFISAPRMLGHLHGGRADGTCERWLLVRTRVWATNSSPRRQWVIGNWSECRERFGGLLKFDYRQAA
jgi:hypothetical protein